MKGGRIVTKDICAICYVNADIVSPEEMIANCDLGGKSPLPICRGCYDEGADPLFSGARKNVQQAKKQRKKSKKRLLNESVVSGCKKAPRRA